MKKKKVSKVSPSYANMLRVTDQIRSASSGKWLTVTKVTPAEKKVIVILNGTMEIDFKGNDVIEQTRHLG